jgi:hypothetical protein
MYRYRIAHHSNAEFSAAVGRLSAIRLSDKINRSGHIERGAQE